MPFGNILVICSAEVFQIQIIVGKIEIGIVFDVGVLFVVNLLDDMPDAVSVKEIVDFPLGFGANPVPIVATVRGREALAVIIVWLEIV